MKHIIVILIAHIILFSNACLAANTLTSDVVITRLDAVRTGGEIRVQTEPRHNVNGLSCPSNFWAVLKKDPNQPLSNFEEMYSVLLLAKANGSLVSIGVDDNLGSETEFCELSRIILEE